MWIRSFFIVVFLFSFARTLADRPDVSEVTRVILTLNDPEHQVRRDAYHQLKSWAEDYPLFMLTQFSEVYLTHRGMEVRTRLEALMEPLVIEHVLIRPPGFIGINMELVHLQQRGAAIRIVSVLPGNPGALAGLEDGDQILKVDGLTIQALDNLEGFTAYIAGLPPGTMVRLQLLRNAEEFERVFALGARSDVRAPNPMELQSGYFAWLRDLTGQGDDFDPDFPVGHFPLDDDD